MDSPAYAHGPFVPPDEPPQPPPPAGPDRPGDPVAAALGNASLLGAPAYRKGSNRALLLGDTEYTGRLPGGWRTDDPAKAALVVCADTAENGPPSRPATTRTTSPSTSPTR
ncbi:hypothetical protein AB5J55_21925 [Streptomyces sp. R11]|uniref:Uncharacterized protein n=1 Tax=Streptomyces sp. R11 TaxID=3238625 RepID=A0AB39N0K7_9ACTN